MRPLLITENFPPDRGGMAQSCDRIVRGLRSRGIDLDVVHLSSRHAALRIEQHERGRLISCPVADDPAHALNLLWNTLGHDPIRPSHLLAFGGLLPMLCAPSFAAWMHVPLITLLRGNDFDTGIFSLSRGWMLRDALARSAAVCAVSTDHRDKVSSLFPDIRSEWIANGIDANDWAVLDIDRNQASAWRAAQVRDGQTVIGLFGHLKRKKGGLFFLDALESCENAAQAHLLIVGEIEAEMLIRLQALPPHISWTHVPFLDRLELLRWYAACDFVAIPSLYDGMPNVALEAGALGLPVLGAMVGGLADLLVDGDNALTFAPGDSHACRRALDAAIEMPESMRQTFGRNLQTTVLREFDQRIEARRYHELLIETASSAARDMRTLITPIHLKEYQT
ncbi:glycosyltransferase family 4 protein [Pseudolysobacter antarcticus]|nr:glycosyltransferase family 4 protein [Pseudolysobacter antarcticus]